MHRNSSSFRPNLERLEEREVLANIITIGDSWAWLVASGAPGSIGAAPGYSNSLQTVLNTFHGGTTVYNESFGGGTSAQHVSMLADITTRINAHPDADIVWLSTGGNDMLLGNTGGGWVRGSGNNANVYASIATNTNTIVNHILSLRSDIQVVIVGYDYVNFWDTISGSSADLLRANLGIIKSGNVLVDGAQNAELNQGFRDAEQGKINVANSSRRVHHINNFGFLSSINGYTGYFGNWPGQGFYPPDLYPALPVRASLMGSSDPIHLNSNGYLQIALRAEQEFLDTALQSAALALSTSSINFGNVRVGTTASGGITATNAGPDFTKVQNLSFAVGTGDFGGGGSGYQPIFRDPTLGSDSATATYTYTPSARGSDAQSRSITSNSGNGSVALSGTGVAPIYDSISTLDFGTVGSGVADDAGFLVSNVTPDGDLGSLTNLTLLSASITGAAAGYFSLSGYTNGATVAAGSNLGFTVNFAGAVAPGTYAATLTFVTDQGVALGGTGQSFQIQLLVTVEAAAPSADAGGPYAGLEGTLIALQGSGTGSISSYAWDLDNNGSYEAAGQNVFFSAADNGSYTVGLQVTGPGGTATTTTTVNVENATPAAGISGPTTGVRGQPRTYVLSATDPSLVDTVSSFTFQIDWDANGSIDQVVAGLSGVAVEHVFATSGSHSVKLVAIDKDGAASAPVTFVVNISDWALQTDDQDVSKTNLVWGGTGGIDAYGFVPGIVLTQAQNNQFFSIPLITFVGSYNGKLMVYGQGAGDLLFADVINGPVMLSGGDGDDVLIGGRGADTLDGGNGHDILFGGTLETDGGDLLFGGAGNDLIMGHYGADTMFGGTGEDLLMAGSLLFAGGLPAGVYSIQAEWLSGRPLGDRVANLSGAGVGPRNNGNYFLIPSSTANDDAAVDVVFGEGEDDWIVANLTEDLVPDLSGGDLTLDLL